MNLKKRRKEEISLEVIKVLGNRFDSFPSDSSQNRNAPFHKAFLSAFSDKLEENNVTTDAILISLSSWLHGLNTTLGQSFFENIAHILSDGEKREFSGTQRMTYLNEQKHIVTNIISDLKSGNKKPNKEKEEELLYDPAQGKEVKCTNFSADNYIEDEGVIEAIELKSVRPNSGEVKGEKDKILRGKAALKHNNPNKKINFFIGFPFDPTAKDDVSYNKDRFKSSLVEFEKFFSSDEILLGPELWDRLSGEKKTMELILNIINTIATPDFKKKFNFINNRKNFNSEEDKYLKILKEWNLYREISILKNKDSIIKNSKVDKNKKAVLRKYNCQVFNSNYNYNDQHTNVILNYL